jgi:hypothetical protein
MTDSNSVLSQKGRRKPFPRSSIHARRAEDIQRRSIASLVLPEGHPLEHGKTYLKLLHGRNRVDENLDDWGFEGPTFGPLDWFHVTYLQSFRFGRDEVEAEIATTEDMFLWEGKYYGDAEIFRFADKKAKQRSKPEYSIGIHNDDGDCYDVVIEQKGQPIATLIAPEGDVAPLVHAGNCYATLLSVLQATDMAIIEAADIMLYEDDKPVTFLESNEIERAYGALVGVLPELKRAFTKCRFGQNVASQVPGGADV